MRVAELFENPRLFARGGNKEYEGASSGIIATLGRLLQVLDSDCA